MAKWQTHYLEVVAPKGVEVQLLSRAQEETSVKMVGSKEYGEAMREQSEMRLALANKAKSHRSPQCMETILSLISGLEPIF